LWTRASARFHAEEINSLLGDATGMLLPITRKQKFRPHE
jgi:hypothetical protein